MDGQVGIGIASGHFVAADGSGLEWSESGLALAGELDAGLVGYKRFRSLHGAGVFSQAGVRGDAQVLTRFASGEENTLVYDRMDRRYGPYANLGLMF